MYFSSMKVCDVLGVRVNHCQVRKNYRAVFYSEKFPGGTPDGLNLVMVNSGEALYKIKDASFTAVKDDFVLWAQGELREFRPRPGSSVSYFVINFNVISKSAATEAGRLDLPPHFRVARPKNARSLFKAVFRAHHGKGAFCFQESSLLCVRLMRLLYETHLRPEGVLRGPEPGMDERIRDTLNFVGSNYKERQKVAELAKRVRMHPVHFNRLFKKTTGLAPSQYILEKKIEKARDFMRLYGDQPNSTAIELGFHDYSHFYRTFKRLSGMTPSQYRAGLSSRTKEKE